MPDLISGLSAEPFLMLHGGAGPMDPTAEGTRKATASLRLIAQAALQQQISRLEQVVSAIEGLEDDATFNAGFGSALQEDGKPRLSAALMQGHLQSFSGVISVSDLRHPIRLAATLQNASSRVLTHPGTEQLARQLGLPFENLITSRRFRQWQLKMEEAFFTSDTVGAVLWDHPQLYAATSTGGRGFETPGRVSDSATVAGTYASPFAAISTTGRGEEIVDDGLAVRLETRVRDGLSLEAAARRCWDEAQARQRAYAFIAADATGAWCVSYTTAAMSYLIITLSGHELASSAPL